MAVESAAAARAASRAASRVRCEGTRGRHRGRQARRRGSCARARRTSSTRSRRKVKGRLTTGVIGRGLAICSGPSGGLGDALDADGPLPVDHGSRAVPKATPLRNRSTGASGARSRSTIAPGSSDTARLTASRVRPSSARRRTGTSASASGASCSGSAARGGWRLTPRPRAVPGPARRAACRCDPGARGRWACPPPRGSRRRPPAGPARPRRRGAAAARRPGPGQRRQPELHLDAVHAASQLVLLRAVGGRRAAKCTCSKRCMIDSTERWGRQSVMIENLVAQHRRG